MNPIWDFTGRITNDATKKIELSAGAINMLITFPANFSCLKKRSLLGMTINFGGEDPVSALSHHQEKSFCAEDLSYLFFSFSF